MVRGMGALRCSPRFTAFSGCGSKDVRCKVPRRNLRESWQIHQIPMKLTASKAPWNFDAWEVGTWNFLFLGTNFACFPVRFQGECLLVTSSKGHLKFEVSEYKIYVLPKIFSNFSFNILYLDEFDDISIYFIYFGLWNSGLQFFERNTSAEPSLGGVSGSEWRCWLEAAKIHPKTHRSKTLNCEFLSNPLNLSFFFKWWKTGGSGWGPSLNGAEWAPVFWNDILASPDT